MGTRRPLYQDTDSSSAASRECRDGPFRGGVFRSERFRETGFDGLLARGQSEYHRYAARQRTLARRVQLIIDAVVIARHRAGKWRACPLQFGRPGNRRGVETVRASKAVSL